MKKLYVSLLTILCTFSMVQAMEDGANIPYTGNEPIRKLAHEYESKPLVDETSSSDSESESDSSINEQCNQIDGKESIDKQPFTIFDPITKESLFLDAHHACIFPELSLEGEPYTLPKHISIAVIQYFIDLYEWFIKNGTSADVLLDPDYESLVRLFVHHKDLLPQYPECNVPAKVAIEKLKPLNVLTEILLMQEQEKLGLPVAYTHPMFFVSALASYISSNMYHADPLPLRKTTLTTALFDRFLNKIRKNPEHAQYHIARKVLGYEFEFIYDNWNIIFNKNFWNKAHQYRDLLNNFTYNKIVWYITVEILQNQILNPELLLLLLKIEKTFEKKQCYRLTSSEAINLKEFCNHVVQINQNEEEKLYIDLFTQEFYTFMCKAWHLLQPDDPIINNAYTKQWYNKLYKQVTKKLITWFVID